VRGLIFGHSTWRATVSPPESDHPDPFSDTHHDRW